MQAAAATSNVCHLGADVATPFRIGKTHLNLVKLCDNEKLALKFFKYFDLQRDTDTDQSQFLSNGVIPASFTGATGFESQSEDWQS